MNRVRVGCGLSQLRPVLLATFLLMVNDVPAEEIYKTVDDSGRVIYSSEPPPPDSASEIIETLPPPDDEAVEAARQRQQKIEQEFSELDRHRAEQEFLREEASRQNNTTVIQNTTVFVGRPGYRRSYRHPGARPAPGAPTAPGYRPPHAVQLPSGPVKRTGP